MQPPEGCHAPKCRASHRTSYGLRHSRDSHWARRFPLYFASEKPILRQHPEHSRKGKKRGGGCRRKTTTSWAHLGLHSARQGEHLWALGTVPTSRNCFLSSVQREGAEPSYFLVISPSLSSRLLPYSSQKQKNGFPSLQLLRRHLPRKTRGSRNSTSGARERPHAHPTPVSVLPLPGSFFLYGGC
ncbi:uncharacterized protein LOC121829498 [Peromyscus maniculatus bairdii]|uniref:uncharacterized protein LOC121829498 n=1 Tax=Peromyscus maniculatus bairdii TaxID=230844 RepID=UPI003FD25F31